MRDEIISCLQRGPKRGVSSNKVESYLSHPLLGELVTLEYRFRRRKGLKLPQRIISEKVSLEFS